MAAHRDSAKAKREENERAERALKEEREWNGCSESAELAMRHDANVHGLQPTRPIAKPAPAETAKAPPDPDDLAAEMEAAEWGQIRELGSRPLAVYRPPAGVSCQIELLHNEVLARMVAYEALLEARVEVKAIEGERRELLNARGALIKVVDQLAIEAQSKATLERTLERLQFERRRLENILGRLVPEGRMHDAVAEKLWKEASRDR